VLLISQPQPKERGHKESTQVAALLAIVSGIAGLVVTGLGLVYFDLVLLDTLGIYCASGLSIYALGITLLILHNSMIKIETLMSRLFYYVTEAHKS
jgi:hypothetical protein